MSVEISIIIFKMILFYIYYRIIKQYNTNIIVSDKEVKYKQIHKDLQNQLLQIEFKQYNISQKIYDNSIIQQETIDLLNEKYASYLRYAKSKLSDFYQKQREFEKIEIYNNNIAQLIDDVIINLTPTTSASIKKNLNLFK